MKAKLSRKLSEKPSTAIRQALGDLRKAERSRKYTVNMNEWHTPRHGSCHVCLAGAVIANRFDADHMKDLVPASFDPGLRHEAETNRLRAMDAFRVGSIGVGLSLFGISSTKKNKCVERDIPEYSDDRKGFYRGLRRLANYLAKAGL